jgi:prophage maintenance system killer protein
MNFEPEFIALDDVLDLHEMQLKNYGGSEGIRDLGLLESAVMTAQASFDGEFVDPTDPNGELYQAMIDLSAKKLEKAGLTNLF